MKKYLSTIIGSIVLVSSSFSSKADITANAAVSSNYFWRGITQTDDGSAVSGGIDYVSDSGFYAGSWLSNVDFGTKTSYEMDLYAGFSGVSGDMGYDVGYIYYAYPDAKGSSDFGELYAELSYEGISAKVNFLSNAQKDASSEEDMLYLEVNARFTVLNEAELLLHLGQSRGDTVMEWVGEDDRYIDYGVSIGKDGFSFGLIKTDLKSDNDIKAYVAYSIDLSL